MASGQTLLIFMPQTGVPTASNGATFDTRNNHVVLDFDDTTGESVVFSAILPANYAGGGLTIDIYCAATSATSGNIGWTTAIERVGEAVQDIDSDGFASANTITPVTVPGTSGHVMVTTATHASGAEMDSLAVGEPFRLKITRDVGNDNAVGDAEIWGIEIRET